MSIVLSVDTKGFEKLSTKLNDIQARIPRAIAWGLNEGGDKVRTQVQRGLQQQTSLVKYQSVLKRVSTQRAYEGGAAASAGGAGADSAYVIHVRGKPSTKIDEFRFRVMNGPGGYVAAKMWGVDHVFQRSFQIKGSEGSAGLRARLSSSREPIRSFDGPNLAKELGKGIVPGRFYATAAFAVLPAIIKQLQKVL